MQIRRTEYEKNITSKASISPQYLPFYYWTTLSPLPHNYLFLVHLKCYKFKTNILCNSKSEKKLFHRKFIARSMNLYNFCHFKFVSWGFIKFKTR